MKSWLRNTTGYALLLTLFNFFLTSSLFIHPKKILGPIKMQLRLIFRTFGLDIKVFGLKNLKPGKTYLFMCNHISFLDHFILLAYLPGYFVGLEKAEAAKIPIYGWAAKRWGQIPIRREDHESALESCRVVKERLENGIIVAIFPEGTRTKDGKLAPFKKGGFHIAVDSGASVVPLVIKGLYPLLPTGSRQVKAGKVELHIGKPIPPMVPGPEAHTKLSQLVREAMVQMLES